MGTEVQDRPAEMPQTPPEAERSAKKPFGLTREKKPKEPKPPKKRKKSLAPEESEEPEEPELPEEPEQQEDPLGQKIHAKAVRKGMVRLIKKEVAVNLILVVLISAVALIFLLSLLQFGVGNFTISLIRSDRYKYGIELATDKDFTTAATRLVAETVEGVTNIAAADLPPGLDLQDGSHNGDNYIAYTFYVRNNGTVDFNYRYRIKITEVTRALDSAIRVGLYYNGSQMQVYAKKAANGQPEPGTVTFASDNVVDSGLIMDMKMGAVDKYTVLIWIDGDDPECIDDRLGGIIKMGMDIDVIEEEIQ
ncbi:MAG: hypothetical protein RR211_07315 [Pseudoflavonifractor sp.]